MLDGTVGEDRGLDQVKCDSTTIFGRPSRDCETIQNGLIDRPHKNRTRLQTSCVNNHWIGNPVALMALGFVSREPAIQRNSFLKLD